jgi:hypothetical protein
MPHIPSSDAPIFRIPGVTFTGLAAPSRGSHETAVWRVTLDPGTPAKMHQLTPRGDSGRHRGQRDRVCKRH